MQRAALPQSGRVSGRGTQGFSIHDCRPYSRRTGAGGDSKSGSERRAILHAVRGWDLSRRSIFYFRFERHWDHRAADAVGIGSGSGPHHPVPHLILSDIHGNLEALQGVLDDAKGRYDRILCLGDLAGYGADPNAVIEWARADTTIIVRGNH